MGRHAAVIGSFKQYNEEIQDVCAQLRLASVIVTSPIGTQVQTAGIEFVRYETDDPEKTDYEVQSLAMHRILHTDFVYVVAPAGYIGRTTCYEIGRIIQARHPIYFSEQPLDLPIHIPASFIINTAELLELVNKPDWTPTWLFDRESNYVGQLERELIRAEQRAE